MFEGILRVFRIPELRSKILFTLLMLMVCRIGVFVPVPGINGEAALSFFRSQTGGSQNIFQMFDLFSGGAFAQMTVLALSLIPNISASIMMQVLVSLFPGLQREVRENPEQGRRKMSRYTRYLTVVLALIHSMFFARYALGMNLQFPSLIASELLQARLFDIPVLFYVLVMMTMTTGTLFLMWIGDQITERGVGNGISLIITLGILAQFPSALGMIIQQMHLDSQEPAQMTFATILAIVGIFVAVTWGTILVMQGHRRIPLQHARRVVGRKEMQGSASYIPLKINYGGVIPVIFASTFLMFPATIAQFLGNGNVLSSVATALSPGSWLYYVLFVLLIVLFTYYWTATQFHPDQIASDMKKNGAFIPGIRQGKPTQEYLETTMNRITFLDAFFLSLIALLPNLIGSFLQIPQSISYFFGGTALLILVGVVLDTMKQVESHLLMKRYDGFMKTGRSKGR